MFINKYNKSLLCIAFTALMVFSRCGKDETDLTGSLIAYISTADHNYGEIYTSAMNGSDAKRISELGAKNLSDSEYFPEFSPDGSKIKYRGFDFMIKVYDVNSKTTTSVEKGFDSEWSPDSKKKLFM